MHVCLLAQNHLLGCRAVHKDEDKGWIKTVELFEVAAGEHFAVAVIAVFDFLVTMPKKTQVKGLV